MTAGRVRRRRRLVPEVVQTSGMDCGPAALSSLLNGCGIAVSYPRLREACHTDLDGTSIDALERIACQLGFPAEQIMVPADHVLLAESAALPAIAAIRNASGAIHFVVVWRCHGPLVQVMDPARGRLWMRRSDLLHAIYSHSTVVPADAWRAWAGSDNFLETLRRRLLSLGLSRAVADAQIRRAVTDDSWRTPAALDAATRMVAALREAKSIRRGDAQAVLESLVEDGTQAADSIVPAEYWCVRAVDDDTTGSGNLHLRGAVLLRAQRSRPAVVAASSSHALAPAITEAPIRPFRELLQILREDGLLAPAVAALAALVAAVGVVFEAVLLRSVLDVGALLAPAEQKLAAAGALAMFAAILLGLEVVLGAAERRMASHLEARLRMTFLTRIPQLADAYFQTRPIADMLERSHSIYLIRVLPNLGFRVIRAAMELALTACAIAWLAPGMAAIALVLAAAVGAIPLLGHSLHAERDLRVRTHAGALARFHLDALRGRTALDAHGATRTLEREHARLLGDWGLASVARLRGAMTVDAAQTIVAFGLAAWLLVGGVPGDNPAGMLLLAYWVLNLPVIGYELALCVREYPPCRTTLYRLLEPIRSAPAVAEGTTSVLPGVEDAHRSGSAGADAAPADTLRAVASAGVDVVYRQVSVSVSENRILDAIDLHIPAGTHVAVVGPSGAGKSSLVGLLLGWYEATDGAVLFDGAALARARLDAVRQQVAWVDPTVHIWNTSLIDNLTYGSRMPDSLTPILDAADLHDVVARLPGGLATPLGENGSMLSTGEAQRVRLGRALLRRSARLVLLDEPFAGLERARRRRLLARARQHWSASTLLYVTHDVTEAAAFDRVIVLDGGRVVEDGHPRQLAGAPFSRLHALIEAQRRVERCVDASHGWRRARMDGHRIDDQDVHETFEQAV
jgi:ATP-binding cassette subfamily B protein